MSKHFHLHSPPPTRQRAADSQRLAIGVTAVYATIVLALALVFGGRLHDWAQQRIVQTSILAELTETTPPASVAVIRPVGSQPELTQPEQVQDTASSGAANQPVASETTAELEPVVNILLLGTDERPDEYSPPRTDTIILLSFNPNTGAIGMLSLPRDLWVPLPGTGVTT